MLTIDLLKGEGAPIKSRPGVMALITVPFFIPVLLGILLVGWYLSGKITLRMQIKKLASYEVNLQELSDINKLLKDAASECGFINGCLTEVDTTINNHMQWSPVLMILAQNLPKAVRLNGLKVIREQRRQKVPQKDDPQKIIYVIKYRYTLRITAVTGTAVEDDAAVQGFIHRLRNADPLASKIEDIRIASQQSINAEIGDFIRYEIDCVFKIES